MQSSTTISFSDFDGNREEIMNEKERLSRIFLVLLSLFVVMLGYGILLPTLPYYTERLTLKDDLDPDLVNFHIGLLTSIYPLFQLLFVILWGRLSDIYGRKPIIITFAAGGAMITPNLLAAVSLISAENTGQNISIQSSTISIWQILGPVLGTWLIGGGFYYPFIIAESG